MRTARAGCPLSSNAIHPVANAIASNQSSARLVSRRVFPCDMPIKLVFIKLVFSDDEAGRRFRSPRPQAAPEGGPVVGGVADMNAARHLVSDLRRAHFLAQRRAVQPGAPALGVLWPVRGWCDRRRACGGDRVRARPAPTLVDEDAGS